MMRRTVEIVCRVLYTLGICQCFLAVENKFGWRRHAVVLLYHHIRCDNEAAPPLSQVEQGVTESTLEVQLREFRKWYQPCEPKELHSALARSTPLNRDGLLVTFDDGYRDNRTLAGPLLRKHGLTGLIFIATDYIESERRFWWVRLNDVVRSLDDESLAAARTTLNGSSRLSSVLAKASVRDHGQRRDLRIQIGQTLEPLADRDQQGELDRLEQIVGRTESTCLPLLDWSEIRDMQRDGFEFGAHTVSHPKLSGLAVEEVQAEIADCVETFGDKASMRPSAFAYPYGDLNDQVRTEVRRAEFKAAYSARPGVATPGRTCRFTIPRIQPNSSDPARITLIIVAMKLSKYLPTLMRPLLSRLFGEPFELQSASLGDERGRLNGAMLKI